MHIALKRKTTRQGRQRGRLHFLGGNVCVLCGVGSLTEGAILQLGDEGRGKESQQGPLTV